MNDLLRLISVYIVVILERFPRYSAEFHARMQIFAYLRQVFWCGISQNKFQSSEMFKRFFNVFSFLWNEMAIFIAGKSNFQYFSPALLSSSIDLQQKAGIYKTNKRKWSLETENAEPNRWGVEPMVRIILGNMSCHILLPFKYSFHQHHHRPHHHRGTRKVWRFCLGNPLC